MCAAVTGSGRCRSGCAQWRAGCRRTKDARWRRQRTRASARPRRRPRSVARLGEAIADLAAVAAPDGAEAGGRQADAYTTTVWLTAGLRDLPAHDALLTHAGLLAESLARLSAAAAAGAESLPDDHRERSALVALADDAAAAAELLGDVPEGGGPKTVAWAELGRAARGAASAPAWALTRSPVTPAAGIREILWERLRSAVRHQRHLTWRVRSPTSGTAARGWAATSPRASRCRFAVPLPPAGGARARARPRRRLASRRARRPPGERLKRIAEVTGGRTLALFTNTRDMHRVAAAVGEHVEDEGVLVLAQGLHGSAASLADEFRTHPETILFGVDTLWTATTSPATRSPVW